MHRADSSIATHSPGYIFHIYDYMEPDLDGSLYYIRLDHAFNILKDIEERVELRRTYNKCLLLRSKVRRAKYLLGKRKVSSLK